MGEREGVRWERDGGRWQWDGGMVLAGWRNGFGGMEGGVMGWREGITVPRMRGKDG